MAVATWQDVAVALGRPSSDLTDDQLAQIDWWLDGVEMILRSRLGDLALLDQNVLTYVEAEAVADKVRRAGRDESSITVSVDDGSVTRRYENRMTAADVTDDLWAMLQPARSGSAYTIGVVSPRDLP